MESLVQRLLPWLYSVLLHCGFLGLLMLSLHWTNATLPSLGRNPEAKPVQALVVDQALIKQQMDMLKAEDRKKLAAQKKLDREAQDAKRQRQEEEARLAALKQQQQQAQQELNRKLAALQQQAKSEQDRLAKLKAEAAKAAKQQKQRKSAEAERRRKQLQAEIAAEEKARDARLASLRQQYVALIAIKIQNNWIKPPTAPDDLKCTLEVQQVPGGAVVNAKVMQCNGDDAVRQSIVTAVLKASPLPPPPDPSLFDRNLRISFCPGCKAGNG
ncbi:MAG TPA: cell envelope integrity protein TolA [Gammaproteobacteria bacterium]|nr:cell envelope integrity protein TolA [Gammaproteobacteria bacterium]